MSMMYAAAHAIEIHTHAAVENMVMDRTVGAGSSCSIRCRPSSVALERIGMTQWCHSRPHDHC